MTYVKMREGNNDAQRRDVLRGQNAFMIVAQSHYLGVNSGYCEPQAGRRRRMCPGDHDFWYLSAAQDDQRGRDKSDHITALGLSRYRPLPPITGTCQTP
jgi:hypothetical protein